MVLTRVRENRTGDTTAVADAGYKVLWVAHWFVAEPRLPANDIVEWAHAALS